MCIYIYKYIYIYIWRFEFCLIKGEGRQTNNGTKIWFSQETFKKGQKSFQNNPTASPT